MKVAILGSTGMLGSMVRRYLSEQPGYELTCPSRAELDAESPYLIPRLSDILRFQDYAINCIGRIKPRIDEAFSSSIESAIQINSRFPYHLAYAAEATGCRVLQIATDCVYSGATGSYIESSPHDATDVYGKTKSLGEVRSPNVHHLRCSIIGPEPAGRPKDSLLEWFLGQPQGAMVKGYTNHRWNGITTLAFAKICHGTMSQTIELSSIQHIVPYNAVAKSELLSHFAYFYHRDVCIDEVYAPIAIDRTLATSFPTKNLQLWKAAGYSESPYIQQMIEELAACGRGDSQ